MSKEELIIAVKNFAEFSIRQQWPEQEEMQELANQLDAICNEN